MASKPSNSITIISSPYHVGAYDHRVGSGPLRILSRDLIHALSALDIPIHTHEIPSVDDFEGEIGKSFELCRRISHLVREAREANSFPIILSGNCMGTVGVNAGLGIEGLGCVWFDAHEDYNTPSTMENGYLDGMGVSMLAGESFENLASTVPGHRNLDLNKFVFCGLRDVSEVERKRVEDAPFEVVWGGRQEKVDFAAELSELLEKRRPLDETMVHVDLDSLDDSYGRVNEYSASGGLFEEDLQRCLTVISQKTVPVSLTVASFNPNLEGSNTIADIAVRAICKFAEALKEKDIISLF